MNELPNPDPISARGLVGIWRDAKKERAPDSRPVIVYTEQNAFSFEHYMDKDGWSGDPEDGDIVAWAQLFAPTASP